MIELLVFLFIGVASNQSSDQVLNGVLGLGYNSARSAAAGMLESEGLAGLGAGFGAVFELFFGIILLIKFFSTVLDPAALQSIVDSAQRAASDGSDETYDSLAGSFGEIGGVPLEVSLKTNAPHMMAARSAGAGSGGKSLKAATPSNDRVYIPGVMNEGQRELVHRYARPYAQNYWKHTKRPNLEGYLEGLYRLHPRMEASISHGAKMAFAQAHSKMRETLVTEGKELVNTTASDIDQQLGGGTTWSDLAAQVSVFGDTAHIPKPGAKDFLHRELTWHQFSGADEPYWHFEKDRLQNAWIHGYISTDEYDRRCMDLYRKTYPDPNSQSPPANYVPYNGPVSLGFRDAPRR